MKVNRKNGHVLLMAAFCATLLIAVVTLSLTASVSSWGIFLLLLLCPAMHFMMHRGMHGKKKEHEMPHTQLTTPEEEMSVNGRAGPSK